MPVARPLRVISVLPSATEILCFIGGRHLLVGRSHEDNYPPGLAELPVLTGQKTQFTTAGDVDKQVSASLSSGQSLYTLNEDLIRSLKPDVILTQDICSVCAIDLMTVERLAASMTPRPHIVSLNPESFEDVLSSVLAVGAAVDMREAAEQAAAGLAGRVAAVDAAVASAAAARPSDEPPPSVAFIEWPDPIYVGGHWTPQIIARAGGAHPLNEAPRDAAAGATAAATKGAGRSFAVTSEAVVASKPSLVVVAPCGLDLAATWLEAKRLLEEEPWFGALPAVRAGRLVLVDGDAMFNRPGPRLVDALEWFASTLLSRPELAAADFPAVWVEASTIEVATNAKRRRPPQPPADAAAAAAKALADIEEAHACAVRQGSTTYIDPSTGYSVFSQIASEQRGHCCGSGCRHCVYGHQNVKPERRAKLKPPIVVGRPSRHVELQP